MINDTGVSEEAGFCAAGPEIPVPDFPLHRG
jgi:hypothetical protein